MEIALHFLRMLNDDNTLNGDPGSITSNNLIIGLADNAIKDMTNPSAKKLLVDEMTEH